MADVKEREYYTASEAAEVLEVSRTTIWRWIETGRLPAYKIGGKTIRIKREDMQTLLKPARESRIEVRSAMERRPIEAQKVDIWAGYDPKKVKEALRKGAGALAGIDREGLVPDIHEEREQASQGRPV